MQKLTEAINDNPSNKKLWLAADNAVTQASSILTEDFDKKKSVLADKDKYNQSLREADVLIQKCNEESENLQTVVREAKKRNSPMGKLSKWIDDLLKE